MLGVGRPTLRVALKALNILGIIINRHGDGNYLTDDSNIWPIEPLSVFFSIKKGALIDLYEARKGLEISSVSLAALRRTGQDLEKMRLALEKMRENLDDYDRFYAYDMSFHRAVLRSGQNDIIIDLLTKIYRLCEETRNVLWKTADSYEVHPDRDYEKHEHLFSLIEKQDGEGAARCISDHMDEVIQRYRKGLFREKK